MEKAEEVLSVSSQSSDEPIVINLEKKADLIIESTKEVSSSLRDEIAAQLFEKSREDKLNASTEDIEHVLDKIAEITEEEAIEIITFSLEHHKYDHNFPREVYKRLELLAEGSEAYPGDRETFDFDLKIEACLLANFSPYPEVRAVTEPGDDPSIPVETFRAYLLGITWTIISTGVNTFFYPRFPYIQLTSSVVQLLLYPCGKAMQLLPNWGFTIRGKRFSLNPGPWTFKEQMFATIMVNVSISGAYFVEYNVMAQKLNMFYGNNYINAGYQFLMTFSSQYFGIGLAGMMRRFVIYPVKQVWPTVLPTLALNKALLKSDLHTVANGWTITRYRFFLYCVGGMFLYYWIPGYLFTALSNFNWITWIAPNNFNLTIISGQGIGLGLNPLVSFDWNFMNNIYTNVISVPFWSYLQQCAGTLIGFFILLGMYYSNYMYTGYMLPNVNGALDNTANTYNVSRVLTNGLLDEAKYQAYSPPYYSAGFLLAYGTSFAMIPLSLMYVFFEEWRPMWEAAKDFYAGIRYRRGPFDNVKYDPFSASMAKYKEVPEWCYVLVSVISFALAIIALCVYPTNTKWWGLAIVGLIDIACIIPLGLIQGITGFQVGLWMLPEIVAGYMFPGNGVSNLILKMYGANIGQQADTYVSDQKMAHYARIPPRAIFRGQLISIFFQVLVAVGIVNWQMSNIKNLCAADNTEKFTCQSTKMIFTDTIMYGVIGPKRLFNRIYPVLKWSFFAGFMVGPFWWCIVKFFPRLRIINPTLVAGGMSYWAPYNLAYWVGGLYVSCFFNFFVRRKWLPWWQKYAYVMTSGFNAGMTLSAIVIFFSVLYHSRPLNWWGNEVSYAGIDGGNGRQTLLALPERGYFGFTKGEYP
ncbi:OPT oligopeptide transporter protein-domain-containing protein [Limtongia smithiae]|uniref:OPT oligopeptide transporter protein-domain-containing protein n=1 Tax=Limtongia smithiae TaxID=1125753 RepID=UPI0034CF59DC